MGSEPVNSEEAFRPRRPPLVSPRHRPFRLVAQCAAQPDQGGCLRTCRHGEEDAQFRSRPAGTFRRAGRRDAQEFIQLGVPRPAPRRAGTRTRKSPHHSPAILPARTRLRFLLRRPPTPDRPREKGVFHRPFFFTTVSSKPLSPSTSKSVPSSRSSPARWISI